MRKWRCVSISDNSEKGFLTLGKIYETDDNGLDYKLDDGFRFLNMRINDLGSGKFEEIKEEEKSMEFKVGDKVRIVKRLYNWDNNGEMDKWIGKVMTIRKSTDMGFKMEEDIKQHYGDGFYWDKECLELVNENNSKSIHITFDNNTTHAVLKDGKSIIKRAKVGLYHTDEYKFETGVMEVVKKLFEEKEDKEHITITLKDLLSLYSSSELLDEIKRRMEK